MTNSKPTTTQIRLRLLAALLAIAAGTTAILIAVLYLKAALG